jgi:hypothetical protein
MFHAVCHVSTTTPALRLRMLIDPSRIHFARCAPVIGTYGSVEESGCAPAATTPTSALETINAIRRTMAM